MPSLTPASEGTETLTPLAEGTLVGEALVAGVETVTALVEFATVPGTFFPGLLPSGGLFPGIDIVLCSTTTICSESLLVGCHGPYPDDNESTPGIEGMSLSPLPQATLTLTPEVEV